MRDVRCEMDAGSMHDARRAWMSVEARLGVVRSVNGLGDGDGHKCGGYMWRNFQGEQVSDMLVRSEMRGVSG